ncbi:type IX secretion system membrane protein PorP/SprF [Carboxylicivirga mesophila]|uniref:Type IX secretion system membrane protein PorP/SprF n=1 Tax=Carboxylicivirga mesophila TaxID=1166478 RepID=A0ABS5KFQ1_9BACT|nr:type IX secretion system membrane protein PorP/SprF [Carboxylicivirga mesophila]MBS2213836.1 type IX secretion system membrane protein PorP/SprF [Carboxylicivirga mesophila]
MVLLSCLLLPCDLFAQSDLISSQYMNSQLMINPAYAGVRNAFSVNALSRQQWMGIRNAPTTYAINMHSPLNKRMASVGASVLHYQSGPVQHNELTAAYSYLLRLNHQMFISLGISAQVNHYNVGLRDLDVIEDNDPSFQNNLDNAFKPNFGAGIFIYSPQFYFGVSVPKILNSRLSLEDTGGVVLEQVTSAYIASGYAFSVSKEVILKPSLLGRYRPSATSSFDVNMQMMYKNLFWIGASYRLNNTLAALLNVQVTETLAVGYSYDFAVGDKVNFGVGSHEISLTFDSDKLIKRNRDRRFNKKKVTKKEDKAVQSIRYF